MPLRAATSSSPTISPRAGAAWRLALRTINKPKKSNNHLENGAALNECWKFLDDNCFFIMIFVGGSIAAGGRRVAKYFNRSQQNRHELRMTRLQRQIGGASVEIVKPVCGCTHALAFHNRETEG